MAQHSNTSSPQPVTPLQVLLFVPNLIGYFRLLLLMLAAGLRAAQPLLCLWVLLLSLLLDGLDGITARAFNQVSSFGAVLDVIVDVLTRGAMWVWAFPTGLVAVTMITLEMLVFACTHQVGGAAWKTGAFRDAPPWVLGIMAKNFKTLPGGLTIVGLMGLPLWCWASRAMPNTAAEHMGWLVLLLPGRLMAAAVELWILQRHLRGLLQQDATVRATCAIKSAVATATEEPNVTR